MQVNDLKPKLGKVDIELEITDLAEVRTFEKFGKSGKVCNATAKDDTGEIALTLWNEQTDQVKVGDRVKITNGYVGEYQGELQLSTGKFGKLEVMGAVTVEMTDDEKEESKMFRGSPEIKKLSKAQKDDTEKEPLIEDTITDDEREIALPVSKKKEGTFRKTDEKYFDDEAEKSDDLDIEEEDVI